MRPNSQPRSAVRRLALARLISITGGAAAFAALNFTVYERTGSAAWLSASLLLTFGVSGVFAPLGGMLGDRFNRKRVMIASDLAGAACFLALAFVHEPVLLLALGFVAAVVEAPFWSASDASSDARRDPPAPAASLPAVNVYTCLGPEATTLLGGATP